MTVHSTANENLSPVQLAVQRLKAELWSRLEGRTHPGIASPMDRHPFCGVSTVSGIDIPEDEAKIGIYSEWNVALYSNGGLSWTTGLSAFLSEGEIYGLFDHYLSDLPSTVQREYPALVVFADRDEPSRHRRFVGSGHQVDVTRSSPLIIPAADELTMASDLRLYIPDNALAGFGFGDPGLRCAFQRVFLQNDDPICAAHFYGTESAVRQVTFYIHLNGAAAAPRYLPIARIVKVQLPETGLDSPVITLELQKGLEPSTL